MLRRLQSVLKLRRLLPFLLLGAFGVVAAAAVDKDDLRVTDYFVTHESNDPFYALAKIDNRISLHVREVVTAGREHAAAADGKVLLLLHGGTVPGYVAFDSNNENCSLMRYLARAGWDTFALDFQGFGLSTRPKIMDDPAAFPTSRAPMRLDVTIRDAERAADFITSLRGVTKIHVLGWSQGASLEGPAYAIRHPERVAKLVLFAGTDNLAQSAEQKAKTASEREAQKVGSSAPELKAWAGLGTKAEFVVQSCFDAYSAAHLASDPKSAELGGKFRFPTGRYIDLNSPGPVFDASRITVPTLLIRGDADTFATHDANRELLGKLSSQNKKLIEIPNAGHFVQIEKARTQLFEAVKTFLDARQ
jgi:pimeloyl-ACP methyl ester carboxylesterase